MGSDSKPETLILQADNARGKGGARGARPAAAAPRPEPARRCCGRGRRRPASAATCRRTDTRTERRQTDTRTDRPTDTPLRSRPPARRFPPRELLG